MLPLLKAGRDVASTPEDERIVATLIGRLSRACRRRRPGARRRTRRLRVDGPSRRAGRDDVTAQIDSLKRWCAARLRDQAYRQWVIFRFPEAIDYWRLVEVQRHRSDLPEAMVGPDNVSAAATASS